MKSILDSLNHWIQRSKLREELRNRNDHLLKDIGLTRYQVEQEYRKPFWKD